MLPKINRLKKKKDFERVLKEGKGYSLISGKLYIKIIENNLKNSRFGFIVSRKFSKKAVIRNRAKRKLRELINLELAEIKKGINGRRPLTTHPGVDVVLIALPGLETKNFWEIEKVINKLFKKAGILK